MIFPVMLVSGTKTVVNNTPVRSGMADPSGYLFVRPATTICVPIKVTFRFIAGKPGPAGLFEAGTCESEQLTRFGGPHRLART